MSELTLIIRLMLAVVLGGLIGFEREHAHKIAGLRTHALVSLGAAAFAIIAISGGDAYIRFGPLDPSRIIAGIITGIGFIGAGAIIRHGAHIAGTTTAASLWAVAALGVAVGIGMYLLAIVATLLVYIILAFFWRIEVAIESKENISDNGKKS